MDQFFMMDIFPVVISPYNPPSITDVIYAAPDDVYSDYWFEIEDDAYVINQETNRLTIDEKHDLIQGVIKLHTSMHTDFWIKLSDYDYWQDVHWVKYHRSDATPEELLIKGLGNIQKNDLLAQTALGNFDSLMRIDGLPIHLVEEIYMEVQKIFGVSHDRN